MGVRPARSRDGGVTAVRVVFYGHATVLLELDGVRLLTDPVLRSRIGPLRRTKGDVPAVPDGLDAVLVSHLHFDHLDFRTLAGLPDAPVLGPPRSGRVLARRSGRRVIELAPGQSTAIDGVDVRATPAEHAIGRHPFATRVPAVGFVVSGSASVYFAGDTDLFAGMESIAPGVDLALLPVSGWGPRVGKGHLDPERAAEAVRRLQPRMVVPVHWGTYRRAWAGDSVRADRARPAEFRDRVRALAPDVDVRILQPGEELTL
jgi:L-ascorbate metabolism protein UlaG (beta-lactamase superfamily)